MLSNFLYSVLSGFGKMFGFLLTVNSHWRVPIAVSLGAVPGALSRYYITLWAVQRFGTDFPYGTFLINLSGALLMGFFATVTLDRTITSPDLRLLVATGFLGAYTTFSTYALDTQILVRSGSYSLAFLYWVGSAGLGVIGCEIGSQIAKRWF